MDSPPKDNIEPTTTAAEDLVAHGQRRINILWEVTQAIIAISVTTVTVFVLAKASLTPQPLDNNQQIAINQLMVMVTLVLSAYFQRTNHQNIGGVGPKTTDSQQYQGR